MLNERTWQFYKTFHCKVTRQLMTEAQMGVYQMTFQKCMSFLKGSNLEATNVIHFKLDHHAER